MPFTIPGPPPVATPLVRGVTTTAPSGWVTAESLGILTTNSATQNSDAIEAAYLAMDIAAQSAGVGGLHIQFGAGIYQFARCIEMSQPSTLEGLNTWTHAQTSLYFANNGDDGIRMLYYIPAGQKLKLKSAGPNFVPGETITGPHGTATVYTTLGRLGNFSTGTGTGDLYVTGVTGFFADNDVITGSAGGHATCNGAGIVTYGKNGAGSNLRNLQLYQNGATVGGNGVNMLSTCYVEGLCVSHFKGNGIAVVASTGDNCNANSFAIRNCIVSSCGGHGFYFDGADSNAGTIVGCTATGNSGWGFYDSSFLGNTFVGCETDANTLGSYTSDDVNARTMFMNCYHEGGQNAPQMGGRTMWFGGLCEVPVVGGSSFQDGYWATVYARPYGNNSGSNSSFVALGSSPQEGYQAYFRMGHVQQSGAYQILKWSGTDGYYEWIDTGYGSIGQRQATYGAVTANGRWAIPTTMTYPLGFYLNNTLFAQPASSPPSASGPNNANWTVGDICLNSAPTIGSPTGWVCTTAGTSGSYVEGRTATANGTTTVTLPVASLVGYIQLGAYLTINGVTARVLAVNSDFRTAGITTMTMSATVPTGTGLAIAYSPPVFTAFGTVGGYSTLVGSNGGTGGDVVTKIGTSLPLASVSATAHIASFRLGIGGTETEQLYIDKLGDIRSTALNQGLYRGFSASNGYVSIDDSAGAVLNYNSNRILIDSGTIKLIAGTGAGASDICVKEGTNVGDSSVPGTAKLWSLRTALGGTEVEYVNFTKGLGFVVDSKSVSNQYGFQVLNAGAGTTGFAQSIGSGGSVTWGGAGGYSSLGLFSTNKTQFFIVNGAAFNSEPQAFYFRNQSGSASLAVMRLDSSVTQTASWLECGASGAAVMAIAPSGRIDQQGVDSSASPGAQTSNKPVGKNAIAAGASSVVVTNSLVSATSMIFITPHARDATCKELIAVPAAGSFTVSGTANATAALPFSWRIVNILP